MDRSGSDEFQSYSTPTGSSNVISLYKLDFDSKQIFFIYSIKIIECFIQAHAWGERRPRRLRF